MFRLLFVGLSLVGLVSLAACSYEKTDTNIFRSARNSVTGVMEVVEETRTTVEKTTFTFPPPIPWPWNLPRGVSPQIPPDEVGGDPSEGLGVVVKKDGRLTFLASEDTTARQVVVGGVVYSAPPSAVLLASAEAEDLASKVRGDGTCPIRVDSADEGESLTLTFADRLSNVVGVINPFQHPSLAIDARVVGMDRSDPLVVFRASGDRDSMIELARDAGFDQIPFAGRMWSLDTVKTLMASKALRRAAAAVIGAD